MNFEPDCLKRRTANGVVASPNVSEAGMDSGTIKSKVNQVAGLKLEASPFLVQDRGQCFMLEGN